MAVNSRSGEAKLVDVGKYTTAAPGTRVCFFGAFSGFMCGAVEELGDRVVTELTP